MYTSADERLKGDKGEGDVFLKCGKKEETFWHTAASLKPMGHSNGTPTQKWRQIPKTTHYNANLLFRVKKKSPLFLFLPRFGTHLKLKGCFYATHMNP